MSDRLRNERVYVWKETFAVLRSRRPSRDAFAVIRDKNEITVVIDQSRIDQKGTIDVERDWKILTFDTVLPFGLVGFFAKISKALADEGISILVFSAYSTDHILVKERDLPKAIVTLENLGWTVHEK